MRTTPYLSPFMLDSIVIIYSALSSQTNIVSEWSMSPFKVQMRYSSYMFSNGHVYHVPALRETMMVPMHRTTPPILSADMFNKRITIYIILTQVHFLWVLRGLTPHIICHVKRRQKPSKHTTRMHASYAALY